MKYIKKTGMPQEYKKWRNLVRGTSEEHYRRLQNPEKGILHSKLLEEQGWLCAYTLRRIDDNSSHIEHIKPESLCRKELRGSDLDYENLVACFPRKEPKKKYLYGAKAKEDWWENNGANFVSPLHPTCEKRFRFDMRGRIIPVDNHIAAVTTIKVLKLEHDSLTDDRKRVIEAFIYGDGGLSQAQAIQARAHICSRSADRKFYEFCTAIRDALDEYLKNMQKIARQKKFARRKS